MFCSKCGKELREDAVFCDGCGTKIKAEKEIAAPETGSTTPQNATATEEDCPAKRSYVISVLSAIITCIIRFSMQDVYRIGDIVNRRNVYCLDPQLKPFFTFIPGLALIIASLIIVADKKSDSQKKLTVFIVNMIFIVVSVLLVWLNFPTNDWY